MMDFIFAVSDPLTWHRENMKQNPRHYSFIRYLGPAFIENFQNHWGARIYFNTLVRTHVGLIKYGVISVDALVEDLLDWDTLYVAGRLHKPVLVLHASDDKNLMQALRANLVAAVHTTLLLLPENFTEENFYHTLAGISYAGDFRMYVGEDKNKVPNIVGAQLDEFRLLYTPILEQMTEYVHINSVAGECMQDCSYLARHQHLSRLPLRLQTALVAECNKDGRKRDLEDVLRATACDPDVADMVGTGVRRIVLQSSLSQALKGIITAGFLKSIKYSLAKIKKKIRSAHR